MTEAFPDQSFYIIRRLFLMLLRLTAAIALVTLLAVVGAAALGRRLPPSTLAYIDFDMNGQLRDLMVLDFDQSLRIRKSLQIDVRSLNWTQQRLIAMYYGIGGEWQSFYNFAAPPVIEARSEREYTALLSPDERYLAYAGSDDGNLYIENLEDGHVETLAEAEASSMEPVLWAADSRALIYRQQPSVGLISLYLYTLETGERMLISEAAGEPAWSFDGQQILYTVYVDVSLSPRVYRYDLASGETRPLLPGDEHNQRTAAWSPNGEWIALSYDDAIAVVRPDGSELQVLTTPFFVSNPLWSPDSRSLIFIAGAGLTSLYKIDDVEATIQQVQRLGGGLKPLVTTLDRQIYPVYPVWQPVQVDPS